MVPIDQEVRLPPRRRQRQSVELGDLEAPFQSICQAAGVHPNDGLRLLVRAAITEGRLPSQALTDASGSCRAPFREYPGRAETRRHRIELRLGETELSTARAMALRDGFALNRWIAALVRARLVAAPQFGEAELQALAKSSFELLAIGRNLNQIARALNIDPAARQPYELEVLSDLKSHIEQHTRKVARLIEANLERWQVGS